MVTMLMMSIAIGIIMSFSSTSYAETIVLEGTIKKKKLKPQNVYLLRGGVFITKKLIVKPGTHIFGLPGAFLVINRGARIVAEGTPDKPIVFTSAAPEGTRTRGDWGGLILNGRAPINFENGEASGEGDTGLYGGNDPADDSGSMKYVRVEYGGFAISPDNELNCVAFQGVGNTTQIDFVEAFAGGDDAFEWFGGTVNCKHLIGVAENDDGFDWTFGWSGRLQFGLIQQYADESDNGIEADNSEFGHDLSPRSSPKMMNLTLIGDPSAGPGSTRGMVLRRGTAGQLRNFIVMGFKNVGVEIRDDASFVQVDQDKLTLQSFIFFNNGSGIATPSNFAGDTANALTAKGVKIMQIDPQLTDPFNKIAPDFRPKAGSPALDAANAQPPFANDPFFVTANYVGAFNGSDDWTVGWTNFVYGN